MKQFYFITVVTLIASCNSSNEKEKTESSFDIGAVKSHIEEANKVYGDRFKTNDTAYYAARYCKDAVAMPEQIAMIVSRDSIRKFYYNDGKNRDFKIAITATDIYGGPGAVIEEGFYTFPGDDGVIYDKGKFIAIWKQEYGKWKLYREIWNTDNAPAKK